MPNEIGMFILIDAHILTNDVIRYKIHVLQSKRNKKMKELLDCTLCPRECHKDRRNGELGYCRVHAEILLARAALHMWEEPCISGECGSGTVFFSGCSLQCVYCQNHQIASGLIGKKVTNDRLSEIFLELQNKKAHNINLVTPTHYIPQIIKAIEKSREMGLTIPIVYNGSGYEKVSTLKLLEGLIQIYLPDFKYKDSSISFRYSNCKDYYKISKLALEEMVRQVGEPLFNENGIMEKGVIVRHLLLPGGLEDSKEVIKYLYETYGDQIFISILSQFTPVKEQGIYKELNRTVTKKEYDELVDYAIEIGVENGFIQEGETAMESFIPDFNYEGV